MIHQPCLVDEPRSAETDLFRARPDHMINMRRSLVRVAQVMPWGERIRGRR